VGVGYFFVWTVFGMAAFPLGVALAAIEMQQPALARAVPIAVGVVFLIAGSLQLTAWKARHLGYCREPGSDDAFASCRVVCPDYPPKQHPSGFRAPEGEFGWVRRVAGDRSNER
jgi:hypothetical protein